MKEQGITQEVVSFIKSTSFDNLPKELLLIAKRAILDTLGVMIAGSIEDASVIIRKYILEMKEAGVATIIGTKIKASPHHAALANGVSAHVLDYDDTQLSTSKKRAFGLLTHPSSPVLSAILPLAESRDLSGKDLLTAFCIGTEVECRIADAINPKHYQQGYHSSGTIGTIGAVSACVKLLDLNEDKIAKAIGIAASMASGLRENFGTMTKSLHVGRAAENGLIASLLAEKNFTGAKNILEAERGFFKATAGGFSKNKIMGKLGNPYFYLNPGVAIKPYPCGSLAHPAITAMEELVNKYNLKPEDVISIDVGVNSNVPNALIYPMPENALEAKFSIQFCIAVMLVRRKAGLHEFKNEVVKDLIIRENMKKVILYVDSEAEKVGYHKMFTRVRVRLRDGRVLENISDKAKGHPQNPLSEKDLNEKFKECASVCLDESKIERAINLVKRLETLGNVKELVEVLTPQF
ncbi:MAG: MmgE/PrpD family protein [Nitrososphaerales archaeon]